MYFLQVDGLVAGATSLQLIGIGGLGIVLGIYAASILRVTNRTGPSIRDLLGVAIIFIGGLITAFFPASTDLFGAYGLGVFIGAGIYIIYSLYFAANAGKTRKAQVDKPLRTADSLQAIQEKSIPAAAINEENPTQVNSAALRKIIATSFNQAEMETICFDLGLDYEAIPGDTKDKKVIELIKYMERRYEIDAFLDVLQKERPNAPWTTIYS